MAKLKIIEIRKGELRKKSVEYKWTSHAIDSIKQISQAWLDTDYAQSVLLFFKDTSGELHAYMPLVLMNTQQTHAVYDLPGAKDSSKIIGVEPYPIKGETLTKEDINFVVKIMEQSYYWKENEVYRMSDQGNYQEFEIEETVRWETIKFGRDKVRAVKKATGKAPAHLVRAIEAMQREYDEQTGFAQCQMESHAYAIRLESLVNKKGRFAAKDLLRLIENKLELFNIASPGKHKPFTMLLAALIPGSSCIVGDYDISPDADKDIDKDEVRESIIKAEERMSSIVNAAPILVDKNKPHVQRIKEFKKATGLNDTETYEAMHDLSKLRAPNQTIKLYSNNPKAKKETQAEMNINSSAITEIAETKRVLASIIEPENTIQLIGKIVELDHYKDDDLKFGIFIEDEAKIYTIHYPEKEDVKVRAKKGSVVSLIAMREKVNRPWYFNEWK